MGCKKTIFIINVFPKTKLVSFTCDPRWFPGQSLRENFFLTRNAVDRSYRHCHLIKLFFLSLQGSKVATLDRKFLVLRTFARKNFYNTDFFPYFGYSQIKSYLYQKCKKIGGHRLRFRNKARGTLPNFDTSVLVTLHSLSAC